MANSLWKCAAALPLLAGCYRYVPADHAEIAPTTPVTVELTTRGTLDVASRIGDNVVTLEGNVTEANTSSLTLALLAVRRRGENTMSTWGGESITLAAGDIAEVKRREFSRKRTAAAASALGAASVGLVIAIAKATGTASGGTLGKPNPNP
jgi:uncharacterized protein with PhoU and TrkA domain